MTRIVTLLALDGRRRAYPIPDDVELADAYELEGTIWQVVRVDAVETHRPLMRDVIPDPYEATRPCTLRPADGSEPLVTSMRVDADGYATSVTLTDPSAPRGAGA